MRRRSAGPPRPRDLERWSRALRARAPIFGLPRRRLAFARVRDRAETGDVSVIPLVAEAAGSSDRRVASLARSLLASLEDPGQVDALCALAMRAPDSVAGRACVASGKMPSDTEDACLFLFVTGQLDAYFEEDFEFQNLRLAYERADPEVKENVMRVVRSGDRRCLGFFGARKALAECGDREIRLALQSFRRHEDWPRLFRAFLELPVRYGYYILKQLRDSGWEPEDPESRSLLRQALADIRNRVLPQAMRSGVASAAFEDAVERGRRGPPSKLEEGELLERLDRESPLETVSIVAALAGKVSPDSATARRVAESPHWLVRLAARLTGLSTDIVRDELEDPNYWVRHLAPARNVLDFWPGRATPAHLEALERAPPEAWEGGLGAARKLLRAVVAHRVTAGRFEEMVVEGDAFAGEFEPAVEAEWEEDDARED